MANIMKILINISILITIISITGCSLTPLWNMQASSISKIESAFQASGYVAKISIRGNKIIVSGTVNTATEKEDVVNIAATISKKPEVLDRVFVEAKSKVDHVITTLVMLRAARAGISANSFDFHTVNGRIIIDSQDLTALEQKELNNIALRVRGVVSVELIN